MPEIPTDCHERVLLLLLRKYTCLVDINTKQICNLSKEKYFVPLEILLLLIIIIIINIIFPSFCWH